MGKIKTQEGQYVYLQYGIKCSKGLVISSFSVKDPTSYYIREPTAVKPVILTSSSLSLFLFLRLRGISWASSNPNFTGGIWQGLPDNLSILLAILGEAVARPIWGPSGCCLYCGVSRKWGLARWSQNFLQGLECCIWGWKEKPCYIISYLCIISALLNVPCETVTVFKHFYTDFFSLRIFCTFRVKKNA